MNQIKDLFFAICSEFDVNFLKEKHLNCLPNFDQKF